MWVYVVYKVGYSRRVTIPSQIWRKWGDPDHVIIEYDEKEDKLIIRPFKG